MDDPIAAIFDMDGVLVDTYQAHFRSWRELAEAEGIRFSEADFAATFGRTSREIIAHYWGLDRGHARTAELDRRKGDCPDFRPTKMGLSPLDVAELDRRKEEAFRRLIAADFPAMPGAVDLLAALHAAGFRLALGSSAPPENVEMIVDRLGARDLFGAIVNGADVTRGKPDPQVFLLAAERLGVPPARCAVVEDAPPGVAAALAAGMAAVGLTSTGRTREDLAAAHAVVAALDEISPDMLRGLIEQRNSAAS